MRGAGPVLFAALAALLGCRDELHPPAPKPVEPPIGSPESIPDAPVSGRLHGAPFAMRDARYVVDRRVAYAHTDILLSAGTAENACGPITPPQGPSVWLRLDGPGKIASTSGRVGPGADGTGAATWQVHYQLYDGERWIGQGDGTALLVLREPGADGRLSGGIAVCFPDDDKSCVQGSFDALACPPTIDQPVRGTPAPEAIPPQFAPKLVPAASGAAIPSAVPSVAPSASAR